MSELRMQGTESGDVAEFPSIEELIPHRGPVVLLDRILHHEPQLTEALVSIADQRWLKREDGSVAGWLAVEYMAQCVAAHEGLLARADGRPPPAGYLVGVTRLRLEVTRFEADANLVVRSRRVRGRPSLGALSHRCQIFERTNGEIGPLWADARLSVSVPRNRSYGV